MVGNIKDIAKQGFWGFATNPGTYQWFVGRYFTQKVYEPVPYALDNKFKPYSQDIIRMTFEYQGYDIEVYSFTQVEDTYCDVYWEHHITLKARKPSRIFGIFATHHTTSKDDDAQSKIMKEVQWLIKEIKNDTTHPINTSK